MPSSEEMNDLLPGGDDPTVQHAKTCLLKSMKSLFNFCEN